MGKPMRTVSFKLPEELDEALSDLASKRKLSRSRLVRDAIERLTRERNRSVTAAVDELTGAFDGPSDLSVHPKHMTGYGE